MAAPRQGLPVRLERAPHRGAAFALSNASERARTRSIGSRSRPLAARAQQPAKLTASASAGGGVANQPVSCLSSLARQRPEILRRAAMFCRLLICRRNPEQHRLAKRASEEIDRYRQLDRFRRQQIARSLTAVGAAHHRAVVDLLD